MTPTVGELLSNSFYVLDRLILYTNSFNLMLQDERHVNGKEWPIGLLRIWKFLRKQFQQISRGVDWKCLKSANAKTYFYSNSDLVYCEINQWIPFRYQVLNHFILYSILILIVLLLLTTNLMDLFKIFVLHFINNCVKMETDKSLAPHHCKIWTRRISIYLNCNALFNDHFSVVWNFLHCCTRSIALLPSIQNAFLC